jgi:hypothetical protein
LTPKNKDFLLGFFFKNSKKILLMKESEAFVKMELSKSNNYVEETR